MASPWKQARETIGPTRPRTRRRPVRHPETIIAGGIKAGEKSACHLGLTFLFAILNSRVSMQGREDNATTGAVESFSGQVTSGTAARVTGYPTRLMQKH
jgi:hypothetical protein